MNWKLELKLKQLHERGLMDAGLVLTQNEMLRGYIAQSELEYGLGELAQLYPSSTLVKVLGSERDVVHESRDGDIEDCNVLQGPSEDSELDLCSFVDRTPFSISEKAPMEYAVEMFGKLGLGYLLITDDESGTVVGVVTKRSMVTYLDGLR